MGGILSVENCAYATEELFMSRICCTFLLPVYIGLLFLFPFTVGCGWLAQKQKPAVTAADDADEPTVEVVATPGGNSASLQEPAGQNAKVSELPVAEIKQIEPNPESVTDGVKRVAEAAEPQQQPVEKPEPVAAKPLDIPKPEITKADTKAAEPTNVSDGVSDSGVIDQTSPVNQTPPVNTESPVNESSPVSGWDIFHGVMASYLVRWFSVAVLVLQEESVPEYPVPENQPATEPQPAMGQMTGPTPPPNVGQPPQEQPQWRGQPGQSAGGQGRDGQSRDGQGRGGQSRDGQGRGGQRGGYQQQPGQQGGPQAINQAALPEGGMQPPPGGGPPGGRGGPGASAEPVPSVVREPRLVPAKNIAFSFRSAPWKDVIEWFADQAALNLQADKMPVGSLNLSDNQLYTPTEALDILNAYLLLKNYALIRKGKTLFVHYLPDGIPPNLLEPITPDELDSRGKYEICRCVFNLSRTMPDIVQTEVERLLGPQGNILPMPKSQQIVITETGATLRTIRDIIQRIDDPDATTTGSLQVVEVRNLTADEAAQMMRRLLIIDENDPSLRTVVDASGKKIFLSGRGDMIERAKSTITRIDESFGSDDFMMKGQPQFDTYEVGSADPATVLAVLQTLLAQMPPDTRLSLDPRTNVILVQGRPAVHLAVKEAIKQMQLNLPKVEIIPLKRMSPVTAVETIKKFYATYTPAFSTSTTAGGQGQQGQQGQRQQQNVVPSSSLPPTVEADTTARQIIVRGTNTQIAEIRMLLAQLGEDGAAMASNVSTLRAIPLSPAATTLVLEQLQAVLPKLAPGVKVNLPVLETAPEKLEIRKPEKGEIKDDNELNNRIDQTFDTELPVTQLFQIAANPILAQVIEAQTPQAEVTISVTPAGLVLTSNDPDALAKLEGVIRMLSDESVLQRTSLEVYYLKNSTASVISSALQNLMGTGTGASASGVASVDIPEWQQSEMMGLVSAQGNTVAKTGTVTIAVDDRLNALYVQANAVDHKTIEKLLKILDQPSREGNMTKAVPRLIKLENMRADEAKPLVETAFANRMQGNRNGGGMQQPGGGFNPQQQGRGGQPQPGQQPNVFTAPEGQGGMPGMPGGMPGIPPGLQQVIQAVTQGRGGGNNSPREQDPGMTVGVYAQDNSLIISSTEALFLEVKAFVKIIDEAAAERVTTIAHERLVHVTPDLARQTLTNILGTAVVITNNRASQGQYGGGNFGGMAGMGNFGGMNNFGGMGQRPMGNFGGGNFGGMAGMGNFGGMNSFGGIGQRPMGNFGGNFGNVGQQPSGILGGGNFGGGNNPFMNMMRPGGAGAIGGQRPGF